MAKAKDPNGTITTTPRKRSAKPLQPVAEVKKNVFPINLDEEIRKRAYELYAQRGYTNRTTRTKIGSPPSVKSCPATNRRLRKIAQPVASHIPYSRNFQFLRLSIRTGILPVLRSRSHTHWPSTCFASCNDSGVEALWGQTEVVALPVLALLGSSRLPDIAREFTR